MSKNTINNFVDYFQKSLSKNFKSSNRQYNEKGEIVILDKLKLFDSTSHEELNEITFSGLEQFDVCLFYPLGDNKKLGEVFTCFDAHYYPKTSDAILFMTDKNDVTNLFVLLIELKAGGISGANKQMDTSKILAEFLIKVGLLKDKINFTNPLKEITFVRTLFRTSENISNNSYSGFEINHTTIDFLDLNNSYPLDPLFPEVKTRYLTLATPIYLPNNSNFNLHYFWSHSLQSANKRAK